MKLLKLCFALLLITLFAGIIYYRFFMLKKLPIYTENGLVNYRVEVAQTHEQQRTGLMYREKLAPNTGMIFLFQPVRVANMWMKNTFIPLDMIFFDQTGRITSIHYHANPQDETIISSGIPVAGVLEINAGEAQSNQIRPGDRLMLKDF